MKKSPPRAEFWPNIRRKFRFDCYKVNLLRNIKKYMKNKKSKLILVSLLNKMYLYLLIYTCVHMR